MPAGVYAAAWSTRWCLRPACRGVAVPEFILSPGLVLPFSVFFAGLLGGAVVAEVIFAVPGLGRLLYDAMLAEGRNYPYLAPRLALAPMVAIVTVTVLGRTLERRWTAETLR